MTLGRLAADPLIRVDLHGLVGRKRWTVPIWHPAVHLGLYRLRGRRRTFVCEGMIHCEERLERADVECSCGWEELYL